MKISIYESFTSKLNKICFYGLFFLQYDIIYCKKEGFGHLIVVKEVIHFEIPMWDNKFCHPVDN